jgi:hypothetical protein
VKFGTVIEVTDDKVTVCMADGAIHFFSRYDEGKEDFRQHFKLGEELDFEALAIAGRDAFFAAVEQIAALKADGYGVAAFKGKAGVQLGMQLELACGLSAFCSPDGEVVALLDGKQCLISGQVTDRSVTEVIFTKVAVAENAHKERSRSGE